MSLRELSGCPAPVILNLCLFILIFGTFIWKTEMTWERNLASFDMMKVLCFAMFVFSHHATSDINQLRDK